MSPNRDILLAYFNKDTKFNKISHYGDLQINLAKLYDLYSNSEYFIIVFQNGKFIAGFSLLDIENPAVVILIKRNYINRRFNKYYMKLYIPKSCKTIIIDEPLYMEKLYQYFNIYSFTNDGRLEEIKKNDEIEKKERYICVSKKKFPFTYMGKHISNKYDKYIVMVYN